MSVALEGPSMKLSEGVGSRLLKKKKKKKLARQTKCLVNVLIGGVPAFLLLLEIIESAESLKATF